MWKLVAKWDNKGGRQGQNSAFTVLISTTVTNRQVTFSYTKFKINRQKKNVVNTGRAAFAQMSEIRLSVTALISTKQAWWHYKNTNSYIKFHENSANVLTADTATQADGQTDCSGSPHKTIFQCSISQPLYAIPRPIFHFNLKRSKY